MMCPSVKTMWQIALKLEVLALPMDVKFPSIKNMIFFLEMVRFQFIFSFELFDME